MGWLYKIRDKKIKSADEEHEQINGSKNIREEEYLDPSIESHVL